MGWMPGMEMYQMADIARRHDPVAKYEEEKRKIELEQMRAAAVKAQAEAAGAAARVPSAGAGGSVNLNLQGLGLPQLGVNDFRDIADPFWQQRGQYQTQLSDLMKNPGAVASSPMYKYAMDQGMEAVNRTAAAKHMLNSGNRLTDLTAYGQGLASQQFFPMAQLLGKFAGADAGSPGAALGGMVQSRGQDIGAATDIYKADLSADTQKQTAQIGAAAGQGANTLAQKQFEYQQMQDALAEQAIKKAQRDAAGKGNIYANYRFG